MKLRIRENSLRLRLTQPEVARICNGGVVENSVPLGPGAEHSLTYRLQTDKGVTKVTVRYTQNLLLVLLPAELTQDWESNEAVGIYAEERWTEDRLLKIAVEKDFKCLDKREGEDETGAYPHPFTQKRTMVIGEKPL